jgi:hypothetical protein
MSNLLAEASTMKMAQATAKDETWNRAYMETLLNPFSMAVKSPKILDGEIKYTAGLKLRATGEIICSPTGNTNIVLFPGLTNCICFTTDPQGGVDPADINIDGTVFRQHLSVENDRLNVRLARSSGTGGRFFLTNSAEEDDGYWEAARLTTQRSSDAVVKLDSTGSFLGAGVLKVLDPDYELANNPTYQFGHLRDLHKYVFKLNSSDDDHKFSAVGGLTPGVASETSTTALTDFDQWDMIFIKIRGRRNAASPSVLRFDTVSNQEIVYAENSPLGRMMDDSPREPRIHDFLEYSRIDLPAFLATT